MENNMEQNLDTNIDANNEAEQQPNQPVDNANDSNQGLNGGNQPNQVENNLEAWQKDGRYGKMWKKPDDVYSSLKSSEKSFNDLSPKYKKLVQLLKDNGFQENTLADELKQFEDYRNPQSRRNQVYNYIENWLNNEIYLPRIQQFFEQLEQEELQRLYPNMSAEQIKKQQEMETKLKQLEATEKQRQADIAMQKDIEEINKGVESCEKLAKEYGFKLTQDVKNYLFDYCGKNNVDPKYFEFVFRKLYGKQLLEARDKKIIENQQKNQKKLEQAQILGGGNSNQPINTNLRGKEGFTAGILKILGKK